MCVDGLPPEAAEPKAYRSPRGPLPSRCGWPLHFCRSYQAQAYSPRDRRTVRKTFATLAEARAWRADTQAALRKGTLRTPTRPALEETAEDWLAAAEPARAHALGRPYKPSALRSYEEALRDDAQELRSAWSSPG
jgi:hypothetical protein